MKILAATQEDIDELVQFVRICYRGESSRKGWTNQLDLVDGIRITSKKLQQDMSKFGSLILKGINDIGQIVGCVHTEIKDKKLHISMLCVNPELQGSGLGKDLLNAADKLAKENNCTSAILSVIRSRTELVQFYERRGFRNTGIIEPYPEDDYRKPKVPLEVVYLEKQY